MKYLISPYSKEQKRYGTPYFADLSKHSIEEYKEQIKKCNQDKDRDYKFRLFEIEDHLAEVLSAEFKNTMAKREAVLEEIQTLSAEINEMVDVLERINSNINKNLKYEE